MEVVFGVHSDNHLSAWFVEVADNAFFRGSAVCYYAEKRVAREADSAEARSTLVVVVIVVLAVNYT